ncbi:MAG: xylulokinase [Acidibacillus sp.]|nr:xylulokinase [Acidibacillus sp.]
MKNECVIGIDLGTTSVKVVAIDKEGTIISQTSQFYEPVFGHAGEVEQEPDDWWNTTVIAIRDITKKVSQYTVEAIGLTGQMHGIVLLDDMGCPIRRAILWNDQRAEEQARQMERELGQKEVIRLTGNQIVTGFSALKLMWIKEKEPDIFMRIAHVLLPKDYIRYKLTNSFYTDVNDASGTLLFDVLKRQWSFEMVGYVGLKNCILPDILECMDNSGVVLPNLAKELGLTECVKVIAGAGDQAAAAVGMGVVDEGICNISLGTSGVVFTPSFSFHEDNIGLLHQFCFVQKNSWSLMGVMLSAAGSVQWWRNLTNDFIKNDDSSISKQNPLLFLPYLSGERTPHLDPLARGAFIGLHRTHSHAHVSRAILEGISFALRDSFELIQKIHIQIDQFRITGGGANNDLWMSILADIFGMSIKRVDHFEGAAYGAAILAAISIGMITDLTSYKRLWAKHKLTSFEPRELQHDYYNELYAIFKDGYHSIENLNRRLHQISR